MPCRRLLHVIPADLFQTPSRLHCMYGRTFLASRPTLESGADSSTPSTQAHPRVCLLYFEIWGSFSLIKRAARPTSDDDARRCSSGMTICRRSSSFYRRERGSVRPCAASRHSDVTVHSSHAGQLLVSQGGRDLAVPDQGCLDPRWCASASEDSNGAGQGDIYNSKLGTDV